ncbi:fatty acid synthase-like [Spodoptera litura]|uniref:Fatty acid synthase-like n=1 Tax=Spodoptera litura TaxID=69820 RepID=A0A9J7ENN6_SPOLT|nr:fatty acid synthase-like [Spodoptera litura]
MPVPTQTAFTAQTNWNHIEKWDCSAYQRVCSKKDDVTTDLFSRQRSMTLHTLKFVPHFQVDQQVSTSLQVYLQIVAENMNKNSIKVVGINNSHLNSSVFHEMKKIGSYLHGIKVLYEEFNESDLNSSINGIGRFLKNADLAIVRNLSTDENMCQLLHFTVQRNCFIVSEEDNLFGGRTRPKSLYHTVCAHTNAHTRLDLVRWRPTMEAMPTTAITVPQNLDLSLLSVARANIPSQHRLLIVCPHPAPHSLKRHIQNWRKDAERNNVYLLTVNKKEENNFFIDDLPDIDLAFTVFDHGNWGGEYYVPVQDNARVFSNVTLQSTQVGDVSSLEWVPASNSFETGIPVTVHYAGLTSTDYKKAAGAKSAKHKKENSYGMDFSGVTESGERVMGLVPHGAASSVVHARPELLWPVPAHWTLEDAATVPLAYAHALYCLGIKKSADLSPETTVFVHRGDGTFGQAAISIALGHGCRVYTTVTHRRNKYFLMKLFPELQADHIGSLRDRNFINTVLNDTKGNGCDIVLSCVKGDMRKTSILCCGMDDICLDFSQLHNPNEDNTCAVFNLKRTRSYSVIDFTSMLANDNTVEKKVLQQMLSEGIHKGYVRPSPRVSYAPHDVSRAVRQLAGGRRRACVLLKMQEPTLQTQLRLSCNPHRSQLIILSEERLGLELVDMLVARGARRLHIHTKTHTSATFQFKLRMLEKMGVEVQTSSDNLEHESDVVLLLTDAVSMGPVQSIYVVTNDDDKFEERVLAHLDTVSRTFCRNLRYFAFINIGKTVYGRETYSKRYQYKLPAKTISLPYAINDITVNDAMGALEAALCSDHTVIVAHEEELHYRNEVEKKVAELKYAPLTKSKSNATTLQEVRIRDGIQMHEEVKGLGTYFSFVDTDEVQQSSNIVTMSATFGGDYLCAEECDSSWTYICSICQP